MILIIIKMIANLFKQTMPQKMTLDEYISAGNPQTISDVEMLEREFEKKNSPSLYFRHYG